MYQDVQFKQQRARQPAFPAIVRLAEEQRRSADGAGEGT
jgi:hypothetical protein